MPGQDGCSHCEECGTPHMSLFGPPSPDRDENKTFPGTAGLGPARVRKVLIRVHHWPSSPRQRALSSLVIKLAAPWKGSGILKGLCNERLPSWGTHVQAFKTFPLSSRLVLALEIMALPNITKPNIIQAFPFILSEPSLTLPLSVEFGFLFPSGERETEAEQALGEDRTLVGKWDWMEEQKEDPLKTPSESS